MQFPLYKHKMKEPTKKAGMLKIVHRRYREHFPEISQWSLIHPSVTQTTAEMGIRHSWRFPTKGILMSLLGECDLFEWQLCL